MRLGSATWLGLVMLALLTSPVSAAPSASDKAVAEGLFQEGRRLMAAGDIATACQKFAESHRIAPLLGTLLNLATCHEQAGKLASAWAEFTEAAALAAKAGEQRRQEYAEERVAQLRSRLTYARIEVGTAPVGTEVRLDGNVIGQAAWSSLIPVDPGEHVIEVRATGKRPWRHTLLAPVGPETIVVRVPALEPQRSDTPDTPSTAAPPRDRPTGAGGVQRAIGVGALGIGAVGIVVGTIFGVKTLRKKSDRDEHCDADVRCDSTGLALHDEAEKAATISTIAFVGGGLAAGTGLVLLLTAPTSPTADDAAGFRGANLSVRGVW